MKDYKVGDIVKGKVTGIEDYGIFLLVDDDVTGLIHISELSHKFVRDVNDYVKLGQVIKAEVVDVNEELGQVKLSIKNINQKKVRLKKMEIEEVGSGFGILHDNLDKWMEEKKEEILQKTDKKE